MKNFMIFLCCICLLSLFPNFANAGVNFIVQNPAQKRAKRVLPKTHTCLQRGYEVRYCPEGSFAAGECPDDPSFFKKCCDESVYRYSSFSDCIKFGRMPGDECGGKYSCED